MARRGSSFAMILLLIVMGVVLVLSAMAWRSVAPEAREATDALNGGPLNDGGQVETGEVVRSGELPRLEDAQRETDQHSARVQEALNAIE